MLKFFKQLLLYGLTSPLTIAGFVAGMAWSALLLGFANGRVLLSNASCWANETTRAKEYLKAEAFKGTSF